MAQMALTSEISALTQRYLIPKLTDNVFKSNALFQRAKKKKWFETADGGTKITQPLLYAVTGNAMRYSGSETLNNDDNQQITEAEWDWKEYAVAIQITRINELKNSGKNAIVNHVKAKVQAAEKSLADVLGTDLFGDGSTPKSMQGIKLMTAATGTYGNLAKATYSWWQAQTDASTTAITPSAFNELYLACSVDSDHPTVGVTTNAVWNDLWGAFQPQQRFADEDTLKAGFNNMMINGIPVIIDSHCDAGYLYLLNENYMSIIAHKDENMRFSPFISPTNQNMKVAHVYFTGAITASNCRMSGRFSALT
jgi:hypothetical protein